MRFPYPLRITQTSTTGALITQPLGHPPPFFETPTQLFRMRCTPVLMSCWVPTPPSTRRGPLPHSTTPRHDGVIPRPLNREIVTWVCGPWCGLSKTLSSMYRK